MVDPDVLQALYMDRVGPDGQRLDARARARYRPVGEREDLAVEAHLALHPLATEGDLEAVRAAERAKSRNSTPYFDFTVSAAKSVSVLHASYLVAARQARKQGARADAEKLEAAAADIVAALMAAARAAVARVERALYVRTGYHSTGTGEYRDAAGATVAMFAQHTSREGDPQLHVHMAVMNLAQRGDGADGKWRTLHSQMLYQERLAVAAYAARELATRLTDLGYHLVPRADGNGFEIGGVDPGVMEAFSSRRAQITPEVERMAREYRQRYGREPSQRTLWAMAQDATLETRKPKARRARCRARPGPGEVRGGGAGRLGGAHHRAGDIGPVGRARCSGPAPAAGGHQCTGGTRRLLQGAHHPGCRSRGTEVLGRVDAGRAAVGAAPGHARHGSRGGPGRARRRAGRRSAGRGRRG